MTRNTRTQEKGFLMTIKFRLYLLAGLAVTFLVLSFFAQNMAKSKATEQAEQAKLRYLSYQLADEFRQTSQDLTRLGRNYVITSNEKYKDAYWNIVNWRSGKASRPKGAHKDLHPGENKPQKDIMAELHFSELEMDLLNQANTLSNSLIATETQAMDSIDQQSIADGPFRPKLDESFQQFSRRILFDDNYHREISKIMAPVDEFFAALDRRTLLALNLAAQEAQSWRSTATVLSVIVFIIVLTVLFFSLIYVLGPLNKAVGAMANISEGEGDLTQRLNIGGKGEVAALGSAFNAFSGHIQHLVKEARGAVLDIGTSSKTLKDTADQTNRAVDTQKASIKGLLLSVQEMIPAVAEIETSAAAALEQAETSDQEAQTAILVVKEAIDAMNNLSSEIESASVVISELARNTSDIGSVIDVIRGIAEQTNLLALNAAIESARAGEQGRGFAVVADEVRQLAHRTQDSTTEIQGMIEGLQAGAQKAVANMSASGEQAVHCVGSASKAGESLQRITGSITSITDKGKFIAEASHQQSKTIGDIQNLVADISKQVDKTSEDSVLTAENSSQTLVQSEQVAQLLNRFKV